MPARHPRSQNVADEASALVDELWRAVGGSAAETARRQPSAQGVDGAGAAEACSCGSLDSGEQVRASSTHTGPREDEAAESARSSRTNSASCGLCPICAARRQFGTIDPSVIEALADVAEAAAVGLRAFADHLITLRTNAETASADEGGSEQDGGECSGSCEDADGRGTAVAG